MEMLSTLSQGSALQGPLLTLNKGFFLTLLRNLDPKNKHVNGIQYKVENITNYVLLLHIATGMWKGANQALPRINLDVVTSHFSTALQDFTVSSLQVLFNHNKQSTGAIVSGKSGNRPSRRTAFSWSGVCSTVKYHSSFKYPTTW